MQKLNKIFISEAAFNSSQNYDIVYSNVTFVKLLLAEGVSLDKLHEDAVLSYYVDYYDQEVKKGNFSKYIMTSKWNEEINNFVMQGLEKIEAYHHLIYFKKMVEKVNSLGKDSIERLVNSKGIDVLDITSQLDDDLEFFLIEENIDELNAKFLRNHKNTYALPFNKIYLEIEKFLGYKFTNY